MRSKISNLQVAPHGRSYGARWLLIYKLFAPTEPSGSYRGRQLRRPRSSSGWLVAHGFSLTDGLHPSEEISGRWAFYIPCRKPAPPSKEVFECRATLFFDS